MTKDIGDFAQGLKIQEWVQLVPNMYLHKGSANHNCHLLFD